jgi:hypothetical protein
VHGKGCKARREPENRLATVTEDLVAASTAVCNGRAVCGWMQAQSFQICISLLAASARLSVIDADVPRYRCLRG